MTHSSSGAHQKTIPTFAVVVPAAGVGKRMQANQPKQYLLLHGKTLLEHTVERLLSHPNIDLVVIAVSEGDEYFPELSLSNRSDVVRVNGGQERVDSVLSGLEYLSEHHGSQYAWALVHDAARPCVTHLDITKLIDACLGSSTPLCGGILASPVRDTMKQAMTQQATSQLTTTQQGMAQVTIAHTVDRSQLWHALTPQMFPLESLKNALSTGLSKGLAITDEASAIEACGLSPLLVTGRADNIKVTQPEDLALAEFFLHKQIKSSNSK
ncbi:2-C-methyl-D-erythritol 4-phosphate cytidylyltransferase [Vibrio algicola]|uniref:2-C-methyl-D-erythritol 4-phosphate cytidylyltransferase n=1 Tax=Vibrio algicola TaxID=2662262 RepID=A0A5Q0TEZ1_9VIBR|nr:2-C-methyl-D-erythritol 4-phosphate cytidylyltransferase [Vibrio algicola]